MQIPHQDRTPRLGYQRHWYWRGWQIRYTYSPATASPITQMVTEEAPLLLIHGFGASLGHWRHNLGPLSQNRRVYALDLLGFGQSQKAAAAYGPLFWSELIHDFWQTFIQIPAILMGNSLGSVACMTAAGRYPGLAQGLIMVNLPDSSVLLPNVPLPSWSLGGLVKVWHLVSQPFADLVKWVLTSPLVINPILAVARSPQVLYPSLNNAYGDTSVVDQELKQMIREPACDRHAAQALRFITRGMAQGIPKAYRAKFLLPQLTIPLLMFWGKQDRLVPPQLAARYGQLLPELTLIELETAGHCPQDEQPEVVNKAVLTWLQQFKHGGSPSF
jgi:pimeloyl-ACP methyl ester carboxylesterase